MEFKKLPSNSKELLDEIVQAENPTQLLSSRFEDLSRKEDEELRAIIRELCQEGYINIPMWGDNKPCHVVVNNSARTYDKRLMEYEQTMKETSCIANIQKVTIGNKNKIKNSIIAGKIEYPLGEMRDNKKKSFYETHPVVCGFLISLVAGFILLLSFWGRIIEYIEGVF